MLDEYEQIASEGKETLMILKRKFNERLQNEEKMKKSEEREREREEKEREKKHELENKKSNLKKREEERK